MAEEAGQAPADRNDGKGSEDDERSCTVCGVKLSSYNPGPNCWQHTIGYPWRGPSAKPRFD